MSIFTAFMASCRREKSYLSSIIFHRLSNSHDKILPMSLVLVLLDCRDSPVNSLHLRIKLLSNNPKITTVSFQTLWPAESQGLHKTPAIPSETKVSRAQRACVESSLIQQQSCQVPATIGPGHVLVWEWISFPLSYKGVSCVCAEGLWCFEVNDVPDGNIFVGWIAWFYHVQRSVDSKLWKHWWNKLLVEEILSCWTREWLCFLVFLFYYACFFLGILSCSHGTLMAKFAESSLSA